MQLVSVAHGTRFTPGNEVAREITAVAGERLGVPATTSYVELCEPLFTDVMTGLDEPAVAVPLLLSTGYHMSVDLPAAVGTAPVPVQLAPSLGPDRLLAEAQVARLLQAGAVPGQPVLMVAAGSNDPDALPDLCAATQLLGDAWTGPVRLATVSGKGCRAADVVTPEHAVSPYLLSPGRFAEQVREQCSVASHVAEVIGAHELVVDLVVARATASGLVSSGSVGPRARH